MQGDPLDALLAAAGEPERRGGLVLRGFETLLVTVV
jgi:hypothetical protein